jgi:LysM repeat protein
VPDRTPLKEKRPELVSKKFHIVQKGDNVAMIAKKYNTSVSRLRKLNKLKSKSNLKVGLRIALPDNI